MSPLPARREARASICVRVNLRHRPDEYFFTRLSKHTARFSCPELPCPAEAVVKGDSRVAAISATSIIAKVARNREMIEIDAQHPGYGLAGHKGYPSPVHLTALERLGSPHPSAQRRDDAAAVGLNMNGWRPVKSNMVVSYYGPRW